MMKIRLVGKKVKAPTVTRSQIQRGFAEDTAAAMEQQKAESEYERANEEVESILGTTRPKHIGEGISSGLGCILRGAVGACGAVVVRACIECECVVLYSMPRYIISCE